MWPADRRGTSRAFLAALSPDHSLRWTDLFLHDWPRSKLTILWILLDLCFTCCFTQRRYRMKFQHCVIFRGTISTLTTWRSEVEFRVLLESRSKCFKLKKKCFQHFYWWEEGTKDDWVCWFDVNAQVVSDFTLFGVMASEQLRCGYIHHYLMVGT